MKKILVLTVFSVKQFLTVSRTCTSYNLCKHEINEGKEGKVYPITVLADPDGE